jgi:membrane fusion protein, multidrug efflux system
MPYLPKGRVVGQHLLVTLSLVLLVSPVLSAELQTVTAKKQTLPQERWFDGTVQAVRESTVSAETSGRVQKIFVDVGDNVKSGAVILTLVSMEQQQSYKQATAAVAEARSSFEVQKQEYQRVEELYKKQLIAKAEVDRALGNFNIAKARLASAEANVKAANERLSYTEVRAPYAGKVSARLVEVGEAVRPGTPLMSGFDTNALRVETDIPHAVANAVEQLHQARVLADNGEVFTPEKLLVFPQVDAATSTVRLRLDLPQQESSLHPGQFVKVAVVIGAADRLLVPQTSIVHRSEVTALYVVSAAGVQLRQVRLGNVFADTIEVLSGLAEGEQVALDPVAAGITAAKSH